jgi:hypothetical protein
MFGWCRKSFAAVDKMNKGVHGQTVGIRIVDFVPSTTTDKIKWSCLASIGGEHKLDGGSSFPFPLQRGSSHGMHDDLPRQAWDRQTRN